jgi:hypothetical protein
MGTAAGASLGGLIGEKVSPSAAGMVERFASPTVQLTASEEAMRGQQLLEGLRVAQQDRSMASFAEPLTQAYIQSLTNLKGRHG